MAVPWVVKARGLDERNFLKGNIYGRYYFK